MFYIDCQLPGVRVVPSWTICSIAKWHRLKHPQLQTTTPPLGSLRLNHFDTFKTRDFMLQALGGRLLPSHPVPDKRTKVAAHLPLASAKSAPKVANLATVSPYSSEGSAGSFTGSSMGSSTDSFLHGLLHGLSTGHVGAGVFTSCSAKSARREPEHRRRDGPSQKACTNLRGTGGQACINDERDQ